MSTREVFVFGNPDIAMDALPIRILPQLREHFPNVEFRVLDPNEEWALPDPFIVIDTVLGITDVRVFRGLDEFGASPTVSLHDFDALFNLRYLAKLGKLKRIHVIGIPSEMPENKAFTGTLSVMKTLFSHVNEEHKER